MELPGSRGHDVKVNAGTKRVLPGTVEFWHGRHAFERVQKRILNHLFTVKYVGVFDRVIHVCHDGDSVFWYEHCGASEARRVGGGGPRFKRDYAILCDVVYLA